MATFFTVQSSYFYVILVISILHFRLRLGVRREKYITAVTKGSWLFFLKKNRDRKRKKEMSGIFFFLNFHNTPTDAYRKKKDSSCYNTASLQT